ncbi:hypothetical protein [Bradyrhizobium sp. MOS002]|uniref:hypothetical protein n=1 Tax=Bradyrhizobium sp. MOS002 TaxID=2133947 RepID=UPI000D135432|nr:hypothetical protein [Bradyrhizobium sp. MOS002]PSO30219.1 hypothetical protein C7G41_19455 [Bradyrhizobium sp. MOS002]
MRKNRCRDHFEEVLTVIASGKPLTLALKSNASFPKLGAFKSYIAATEENRIRYNIAKEAGFAMFPAKHKQRRGTAANHFNEIISELRKGRSLTEVLRSDARFPTEPTFYGYVYRNPQKMQEYRAARWIDIEAYFPKLLSLIVGGLSCEEACASSPSFPTYSQLIWWVRKAADRRAKLDAAIDERSATYRPTIYSDSAYDEAIELVRSGSPLSNRQRRRDLPQRKMLETRSRADQGFGVRYRQAVHQGRSASSKNHLRMALLQNDVYRQINAVVPKLDRADREDVLSDMVMAVLADDIDLTDVKQEASRFLHSHNRRFRYGTVSLDAPMFEDNEVNMLDLLSTNDWTAEGAI